MSNLDRLLNKCTEEALSRAIKEFEVPDKIPDSLKEKKELRNKLISVKLESLMEEDPNLKAKTSFEAGKNYNITKKYLGKLDYTHIETIWRGLHNINLPHEILTYMNPTEIVALAYGTQITKESDIGVKVFKKEYCYEETSKMISKLVGLAYREPKIRKLEKEIKDKPYEHGSNDLIKRIRNNISVKTLKNFKESFFEDYKPSAKEISYGYFDPNIDGINKNVYIKEIISHLNNIQKK